MDEKLPLKRVQLSAKKFNEEAVPYNLGLLKNHRSQIEKSLALGDWTKVKQEEINASRIVKQMKNLMLEMDVLREKVRDDDLEKFDDIINVGKENAMKGMKQYLGEFLFTCGVSESLSHKPLSDNIVVSPSFSAVKRKSFVCGVGCF